MAREGLIRRREVPPVDEQTRLGDPIKVRWPKSSTSRSKFLERGIGIRLQDRDPSNPQYKYQAVGVRAFNRQKTNVVFKTVEEAMEVYSVLGSGYTQGQYTWNNEQMAKTFRRVHKAIGNELQQRGYDPSNADAWLNGNVRRQGGGSRSSSTGSSSSSTGRGNTIGEKLREKRDGSTAVSRANDLTETQRRVIEYTKKHPDQKVSQAADNIGVSGAYFRKTLRQYHGRVN